MKIGLLDCRSEDRREKSSDFGFSEAVKVEDFDEICFEKPSKLGNLIMLETRPVSLTRERVIWVAGLTAGSSGFYKLERFFTYNGFGGQSGPLLVPVPGFSGSTGRSGPGL